MSLYVHFIENEEDLSQYPVVTNFDKCFKGVKLGEYKEDSKVLEYMELAKIVDAYHFEDRFGNVLPSYCLSSSSKAVLELIRSNDKVLFDLLYFDYDCICCALTLCKNGRILIRDLYRGIFNASDSEEVDVILNNEHITTFFDLFYLIQVV